MEVDGANGTSLVDCSMSRNGRRDSHGFRRRVVEASVKKRRGRLRVVG
jgi:hypothetical protein